MRVRGRLALAVVSGGVALGAVLGSAANPVMKNLPEQPRPGALQAPVTADAGYQVAAAGSGDPGLYRDSYAPIWAGEELADWEPAYPAWSYSDFGADQPEPPADEQPAAVESGAPAPPEPAPQAVEPDAFAPEPQVAGGLAAIY